MRHRINACWENKRLEFSGVSTVEKDWKGVPLRSERIMFMLLRLDSWSLCTSSSTGHKASTSSINIIIVVTIIIIPTIRVVSLFRWCVPSSPSFLSSTALMPSLHGFLSSPSALAFYCNQPSPLPSVSLDISEESILDRQTSWPFTPYSSKCIWCNSCCQTPWILHLTLCQAVCIL